MLGQLNWPTSHNHVIKMRTVRFHGMLQKKKNEKKTYEVLCNYLYELFDHTKNFPYFIFNILKVDHQYPRVSIKQRKKLFSQNPVVHSTKAN